MLKLNQKEHWLRKRATDGSYAAPFSLYINLLPAVAGSDLIAFGAAYVEHARFNVHPCEMVKFNIGDLIYDKCPVFKDELDVGNASHVIAAILPTVRECRIDCKLLSGVTI